MSGTAVLVHVLKNAASIVAVVPSARIYAGVIPLATAAPAIGVTQISGARVPTVALSEAKKMNVERVQVTIKAKTYPELKSILALVNAGVTNRHGTVNGVDVDSIHHGGEGPDLYEPDESLHTQSIDFIVKWRT